MDFAVAGDLAVAGTAVARVGIGGRGEQSRLDERVLIEEIVEALARVEHAGSAAAGELGGSAHGERQCAALFEIVQ